MKPDWKDAPDWANYLAMDETGHWAWFEQRPRPSYPLWINTGGKCQRATPENPQWEQSLEARPK